MYQNENQRTFARILRNEPTPAELRLWYFLRAQKHRGHKFRRQAAIGSYIVDFICFELKLIIELDGPQHLEPSAIEHDARRTNWLTSRGFKLLHFRNQELDENIHAVVDAIELALIELERSAESPPLPNPPRRGEGVRMIYECGGRREIAKPNNRWRSRLTSCSSKLPVPSPRRGGLGRGRLSAI